jgi:hypothetical protein
MAGEERTTSEPTVPLEAGDEEEASTSEVGSAATLMSGRTIVLWALCSCALLAFVMLGSVPTYVWRFGRLYEESRPVLGIWTIEMNDLPRVSQQWILDGAFNVALIVFLLGAIAGLWFLLGATEGETASDDTGPDSETTVA